MGEDSREAATTLTDHVDHFFETISQPGSIVQVHIPNNIGGYDVSSFGTDVGSEIVSLREKVAEADRIGEMASKRIDALIHENGLAGARILELEEALRPFAEMAERRVKLNQPDGDGCEIVMSVREMRRAGDVLNRGCQATVSQADSPGSASLPTDQSGSEE